MVWFGWALLCLFLFFWGGGGVAGDMFALGKFVGAFRVFSFEVAFW